MVLHGLPLAWDLVRAGMTTSAAGPLRAATNDFISTLHDLMGDSLFDHTSSSPGSTPQLVERMRQMVEKDS